MSEISIPGVISKTLTDAFPWRINGSPPGYHAPQTPG